MYIKYCCMNMILLVLRIRLFVAVYFQERSERDSRLDNDTAVEWYS